MHPRQFAIEDPDRPAIIMAASGQTTTYAQLEASANRGAHLLRKCGLARGDTVAILAENRPEFLMFYWAAQRCGLYITPISTRATLSEASYILADSGAKFLLLSPHVQAATGLLAASADQPALAIYGLDDLAGVPDWQRSRADQPETPIPDESPGFHMVYSSGTTGRPKGVRLPLPEGDVTGEAPFAPRLIQQYGLGQDTVYLSPAPLYHTAPLMYSTTMQRAGATTVVMEHFDAAEFLRDVERYGVTFTQMVPTMFVRLLKLSPEQRRSADLSSLRAVVHAAAPCPVPVKQAMMGWLGPIIFEYYGGTEGNGATYITPEEWLAKPGSVGRAVLGVIHICGDDGEELPPGGIGTVYFGGSTQFEYHNDPAKTRDSRHPRHAGWSTLGDVGYLDEDGYLFITDRKTFMIICGGVNVYPQEVENLLVTHPKVADAAVIGIPHADLGEEVKAIVQPLDWSDAGPDLARELIAFCRKELSGIKCPRSVDFERELPRHATGKLYKQELKRRYAEPAA